MSRYEQVTLGSLVSEYSERNRALACNDVYSVTNSAGFVPSTDYFSKEVFSKDISNYKTVHKGMFAYNPSRVNVGSLAWLKDKDTVVVSPLYVVFKIEENKLRQQYLEYYLHSDLGISQIRSLTSGSVRDSLKFSALARIVMPLPPLEKQERIIAALDCITEVQKKRREQIAVLDKLATDTFVDMFGDGKEYEARKLSDVSVVIGGLTKNSAKRKSYTLVLPYLRVANVQFNSFDLSEIMQLNVHPNELGKGLLKKDDLLFVEGNGSLEQIGRVAVWDGSIEPCVHQNHLIKARFKDGVVIPQYAMYYFMSLAGRKQIVDKSVTTTGLNTLSVSKVESLQLPVPSLDLQHKFTSITEKTERQKSRLQTSLAELATTYKSILQNAFNGELFH
ncbi:MAG: restriction endonuclease subunit S [Syntrophomonadaceae bacterium]